MSFAPLGLRADLLRAVETLGFARPTPIQEEAIPPALAGRDVLASAATGSGKTAAFALPLLQRLAPLPRGTTRGLILAPTRELAAQVHEHIGALARGTGVTSAPIVGGLPMGPQERAFRSGADIIVATPGRLLDHMRSAYARLAGVEVLVLDEADRMLDMGFLPDVRRILGRLPAKRQTLFFSATFPSAIASLAKDMLRDPVSIHRAHKPAPPSAITQAAYSVAAKLKPALLMELLKRGDVRSAIVFTRTKHRANRLCDVLVRNGIAADRIHGNRSQAQRTQALGRFKSGKFQVLVATDIAARGIDVEALSHVVNFDVPNCPEDYVHRVGRTGRADAAGDAFIFVSPEEESSMRQIETVLGKRVPRATVPGFQADAAPERLGDGDPKRRPGRGRFGRRRGHPRTNGGFEAAPTC